MNRITNWKKNIVVFKIDSVLNWFYVPIGTWVLIWTQSLTYSQIGLAMSISLFWSTLLELPSGALADMIGRKKTIILGRLILFLSYILLFFKHDFLGFVIWNMLYQTDAALNSGAQSALLYDSLLENKQEKKWYKKTEADTFMYCTLGMVVASIVSGYLFKIDVMLPYTVMIGVTGMGLIASLFYQEPSIDSEKWSFKGYIRQNYLGVKHIFENKKIRAVSIFSIAVGYITYTKLWYLYEPRLSQGGFDPRILSTLVAGGYLVRAIGTRTVDLMDKFFSKKQVPVVFSIIQTVSSGFSFVGNKFGAIGSVYLGKFSDGFRQPTVLALQNEQIKSQYRATSLSALSLITNLLVSLVGIGIGTATESLGVPISMGLLTIIGLLVVIPSSVNLSNKIVGK